MDALFVLTPACLRALASVRYSRILEGQLAVCRSCGPCIKRLLRAVSYRKQHAALTVAFHARTAVLALKHRKKFAAYVIGLRFKSKRLLPQFLDNPIRVAFMQKRQFQGSLEKQVLSFLQNPCRHCD
jgi:hypothetical protein